MKSTDAKNSSRNLFNFHGLLILLRSTLDCANHLICVQTETKSLNYFVVFAVLSVYSSLVFKWRMNYETDEPIKFTMISINEYFFNCSF